MKRLAAVLGVLFLLAACGGGPDAPGEAAFNDANNHMTTQGVTSQGVKHAAGNGPVAVKLAEQFNERMKLIMKIGFKNRITDAAVDNDIITYVNLTEDAAVFLVYIPALRNYKEDAQGTLLDVAWPMALGRVKSLEPEVVRKVAVGLRGVLLYGALASGSTASEIPDQKKHSGAILNDEFYPFFTGKYPADVAFKDESSTTAAPAAAATAAAPSPAAPASTAPADTRTEIPDLNDRVTPVVGQVSKTSATAVAVAPDLFVTVTPAALSRGTIQLIDGSTVEVSRLAITRTGICVFQVAGSTRFEPIPVSPSTPNPGDVVTTYFSEIDAAGLVIRRFRSNITTIDEKIHTDQRLAIIPLGAPLLNAQGRLIGIGTESANVYASLADIRNAVAEARAKTAQ